MVIQIEREIIFCYLVVSARVVCGALVLLIRPNHPGGIANIKGTEQ